jgi:YegS/Rv2252/BmrU family lipid kinase
MMAPLVSAMDTSPFVLVVNPHAGAGRAARQRPHLEKALREGGARFETRLTERPGHATEIVREALDEGASGIAVVGGDGTLNEAVNGFFEEDGRAIATRAWLGPLPCGTGGDFRRTLGIPRAVGAMATRMLFAEPRAIDCGYIEYEDDEGARRGRAFINIAGFGAAGLVDELVNQAPKWMGGTPAFLFGAARAVARYRPQRVRITVDDAEPYETEILSVAVANGRYFGGGMHVAPEAEIDDGLFEVVTIEAHPVLALVPHVPALYRGRLAGKSFVRCARGRRVTAEPCEGERAVLLDVDGEAPGRLPATFEVRPGAIRLRA